MKNNLTHQLDLNLEHVQISANITGNLERQEIPLKDGNLILFPNAFTIEESDYYLESLLKETKWMEQNIRLFHRTMKMPRLTAWYSDPGINYRYSNITPERNNWTSNLTTIKKRVEELSQHAFNGALLNLYRNGQDSMSWHSDNEKSLGPNPVIASVSFGATRSFQLKHCNNPYLPIQRIPLPHGSLLLMQGNTQTAWKHQLPKEKSIYDPRINLTFRKIISTTH